MNNGYFIVSGSSKEIFFFSNQQLQGVPSVFNDCNHWLWERERECPMLQVARCYANQLVM